MLKETKNISWLVDNSEKGTFVQNMLINKEEHGDKYFVLHIYY